MHDAKNEQQFLGAFLSWRVDSSRLSPLHPLVASLMKVIAPKVHGLVGRCNVLAYLQGGAKVHAIECISLMLNWLAQYSPTVRIEGTSRDETPASLMKVWFRTVLRPAVETALEAGVIFAYAEALGRLLERNVLDRDDVELCCECGLMALSRLDQYSVGSIRRIGLSVAFIEHLGPSVQWKAMPDILLDISAVQVSRIRHAFARQLAHTCVPRGALKPDFSPTVEEAFEKLRPVWQRPTSTIATFIAELMEQFGESLSSMESRSSAAEQFIQAASNILRKHIVCLTWSEMNVVSSVLDTLDTFCGAVERLKVCGSERDSLLEEILLWRLPHIESCEARMKIIWMLATRGISAKPAVQSVDPEVLLQALRHRA